MDNPRRNFLIGNISFVTTGLNLTPGFFGPDQNRDRETGPKKSRGGHKKDAKATTTFPPMKTSCGSMAFSIASC